MHDILILGFWFLSMPLAALDNARDYGPYGVLIGLVELFLVFVGGLIGWSLLGPASVVFNIIFLAFVYVAGVALTYSIAGGDDDSTLKWGIILFLSGFILSKFVFWLVLIY